MSKKRKITLTEVIKSFKTQTGSNIKIPKTIWRAKINGNFIVTSSGKTVWTRIGDVKNAIRYHIQSLYEIDPWNIEDNTDKLYQELFDKKIIELVELFI